MLSIHIFHTNFLIKFLFIPACSLHICNDVMWIELIFFFEHMFPPSINNDAVHPSHGTLVRSAWRLATDARRPSRARSGSSCLFQTFVRSWPRYVPLTLYNGKSFHIMSQSDAVHRTPNAHGTATEHYWTNHYPLLVALQTK